jgi:hypothetical protein
MQLQTIWEQELEVEACMMKSGDKKITRFAVLELVKRLPMPLTTKEMGRILMVKEVSVRAALIWLEIGGFVKKQGTFTRRYEGKTYTKTIAKWVWTGKTDDICKVNIKETDAVDRARNSKFYGDSGAVLQSILLRMGKKI